MKLISENDLCKSDIENDNEKSDDKVVDINDIATYRKNNTDSKGYVVNKSYPKTKNKFNNFKQREYTKEEWEELENTFFN